MKLYDKVIQLNPSVDAAQNKKGSNHDKTVGLFLQKHSQYEEGK